MGKEGCGPILHGRPLLYLCRGDPCVLLCPPITICYYELVKVSYCRESGCATCSSSGPEYCCLLQKVTSQVGVSRTLDRSVYQRSGRLVSILHTSGWTSQLALGGCDAEDPKKCSLVCEVFRGERVRHLFQQWARVLLPAAER
ncbi:unnamed protein product [Boreogadus saida]